MKDASVSDICKVATPKDPNTNLLFSRRQFKGHLTASMAFADGETSALWIWSIMCPPSLRAELAQARVTH